MTVHTQGNIRARKVALEEYTKEQRTKMDMYGANPCVPKCDYPTLKICSEQKQTMDGNQNRQCSLMYQEHIESSSNVPTRRTVPLAVDAHVIVLG